MSSNFDHGDVGQVYPHDKAALGDRATITPTGRSDTSVSGRMFLAVTFGAFVGYLLSFVFAPGFALPFVLGGAMSFGAGAVALFLFKPDEPAQPDEYNSGFARTDEEIHQALSDKEARKK